MVAGDKVDVTVAAKGGGSENKAKLAMLNPSDDIVEWVLKTVPTLGAGWCPPGVLGLGIGGTPEKAMYLAKKIAYGPGEYPRAYRAWAPTRRQKNYGLNCLKKSMHLALELRVWAA